MEGLNFGGAVGGFRSSFYDQDMVDANHVSPKVPLVTVELRHETQTRFQSSYHSNT